MFISKRVRVFGLVLLALFMAISPESDAQQHIPGSICYVGQFWCWANPPGPVGAPCACPTPYGIAYGRLG